jgi:hypothetical protein
MNFIIFFKKGDNMKVNNRYFLQILLMTAWLTVAFAQTSFDLESGLVSNAMNDVGIPGDTGTRFSLTEDLSSDAQAFLRLRVSHTFGEKHTFSVLYAPLEVKASGRSDKTIDFAGVTFPANENLNAIYMFNSYRLTYRYDFIQTTANEFGMGLTAKIRDAKIALEGNGLSGEKTNVGFVPIINFRYRHYFSDKFSFLLEGDALAAPQGRAEDVLLAATYSINPKLSLKAGYRILEGGSDNDEVYGFALFNYAVLGATIKF